MLLSSYYLFFSGVPMDTNELEVLSEICWRNQKLSEKAETIVARVIAATWNERFRMDALEVQLQEFRKIAKQEGINLNGIDDSDLYSFIIRRAAGCQG